jgi:hypothetical protein
MLLRVMLGVIAVFLVLFLWRVVFRGGKKGD